MVGNMEWNDDKAGWRVAEWCRATSFSRAYVYILINRGEVRAVKSGRATVIITAPSAYLATLPQIKAA